MKRTLTTLMLLLAACGTPQTTENTFAVIITGEGSATDGIAFPPEDTGGEPYFLDGWEIHFTRVLVTVDDITFWENPDQSASDQSQHGAQVSQTKGPWAVNLAKAGPLDSKEQNGKAWPLTTIKGPFAADTKYAFGFSLVAPGSDYKSINLDADDKTELAAMAAAGQTVLLEGDATFKGTDCRSTDSNYVYTGYPTPQHFKLAFAIPTDFVNCVNPELQPAESRGVQAQAGVDTQVQITFHLDHAFWEALIEDAPLRWDALAATGKNPVTLADLAVPFQPVKDSADVAVPWRTCGPTLDGERTTGVVTYDTAGVPVNPAGGAAGLANLADYMKYNLSTFGHLNNDGLCFPSRKFPSPP